MPSHEELKSIFEPVLKKVGVKSEDLEALFSPEGSLPETATTHRDAMASLLTKQVAVGDTEIRNQIRKESFEEAEKNLFEKAKELAPNVFTDERISQINSQKKYSNKGAAIFAELHKVTTDPDERVKSLKTELETWKEKASKGGKGYEDRINNLTGEVKTWQQKAAELDTQLREERIGNKLRSENDILLGKLRPVMKKFGKGEEWIRNNAEEEFIKRVRNMADLVPDEGDSRSLVPRDKKNPNLGVYGVDQMNALDTEGLVMFVAGKMGILDKGKGGSGGGRGDEYEDKDEREGGGYRRETRYKREGEGGGSGGSRKKLTPAQEKARAANRRAIEKTGQ